MSVSSWEPSQQTVKLTQEQLQQLLALSTEQIEAIDLHVDTRLEDSIRGVMQQDLFFWQQQLIDLSNQELCKLMQVFTTCEQLLDDCHAGDRSPVIYIGKILKAHKAFPDQNFVRWIKQHSDNRFLPHGPLL